MKTNIEHYKKLAEEKFAAGETTSLINAFREVYLTGVQDVLDELQKNVEYSIGYQYKENGPWDNDGGEVFTDLDEALGEFYAFRDTYLSDDTVVKRYTASDWVPVDKELLED